MKVVLLCKGDHSNVAYDFATSFRSVGMEAEAFKALVHPVKYPNQAKLIYKVGINNVRKYVSESDVVIFIHSEFIETGVNLKNKLVYVMHTGSTYRQNSDKINNIFNPIVSATLLGGDLLGMGAKNEIWIIAPININLLNPNFDRISSDRLVLGHFPSSSTGKGTDIVLDAITNLQQNYDFEFRYSKDVIPWLNQIKRMSECDIYIENYRKLQGNVEIKFFGITTLEAASLGKIVVTRFPMKKEYENQFGKCSIFDADSTEELKDTLSYLLSLSDSRILELKKESRSWVERIHSYEAVGNNFKRIFEKDLSIGNYFTG